MNRRVFMGSAVALAVAGVVVSKPRRIGGPQ